MMADKSILDRRSAGVLLHISSLPGPFGIGEIGDEALRFVDCLRAMRLGVWQFLPIGPTAYGDSPYQPLSTFAGNEMLISVGDLLARGLLNSDEADTLRDLPPDQVDYGRLIPRKSALLRLAASRFETAAPAKLLAEFDAFLERNDARWLHDYALFRILKSRHDERPWFEWEPRYMHRDAAALNCLVLECAAEIRATKIIQFLFHCQWRRFRDYAHSSGIRLFGDLPIYIALDSADAWAHPELLQIDGDGRPTSVAGVPPDYFSEDGQLWGNPLYAWDAHAADGFHWWVERMRAATELADIVRIDHFRGFEAYWSVPADAESARGGAWVPGVGDAIFNAMRSALGGLPIVAENLGVITPEVEALRERQGIPGMVVLQFAIVGEDAPLDTPEDCVCYTGTHDNDTTLGWFCGSPDDIRSAEEVQHTREAAVRVTRGRPETIHLDLVRAAFFTRAWLAMAPLQDYLGLGSEARMNVPGTSGNNWRWRVDAALLTDDFCNNIAAMVRASGRDLPGAPRGVGRAGRYRCRKSGRL